MTINSTKATKANEKDNNTKKTRARSAEDKQKQMQRIINYGRELFHEHGVSGFSMRQLGRKLEMSSSNLYNYVDNKRELWYAIVKQDFDHFAGELTSVLAELSGNFSEILDKLVEQYFAFASEDYQRFRMMHLLSPPVSEKSAGPIEISYRPIAATLIIDSVKQAMKDGDLPDGNPLHYIHLFNAVALGAVLTTSPINSQYGEDFPSIEDHGAFFQFVRKQFQKLVK